MANKMLIDAAHPEETRVVVLRGNRVEEFDFESANKKPLRGNIYLAKVTRVEPSLQAAFVDYGGNRHGFLAFSEIHPDYYQIPVSDRQALLDEDAAAHRDDDDDEGHGARRSRRHRRSRNGERAEKRRPSEDETIAAAEDAEIEADEAETLAQSDDAAGMDADRPGLEADEAAGDEASQPQADAHAGEAEHAPHMLASDPSGFAVVEEQDGVSEAGEAAVAAHDDELEARFRPSRRNEEDEETDEEAEQVEQLGGDAMEEMPSRPHRMRRQYKIQEVIKRRQVLLVQVVKEERGNKGAALTTYLSLAGRYSVLMPNTARGGGISRKITDAGDRQRLKAIAQELEVPDGMGVILRTAGASRTKAEVKRDFEYLLRMWETVREVTLKSTAPTLVYEEGSLVKRAIRDLYNKDIDDVIVAGEVAYHEAKEFMRMLMPSHAKNVHLYRDPTPVFAKSGVESQLDAMFSNHVSLKSGGYLVINQTEALVAIDVNSGRSTREHNIEDTALRTNLEAADEIARQLRLRDLAGLIVIDFIDMEESRNNRSVERRMKEALKNDRARIQIGRISHFGLLEMSRQRIRTGVLEGSTAPCPHCGGAGTVRSTSSIALHVLRVLEDALIKSSAHNIIMRTRAEVALYILNQKRANLSDLEQRFGVAVTIVGDDTLTGTAYHAMERGEPATGVVEPRPEIARAHEAPALAGEEADEEDISGEEEEAGPGRDDDEGSEGGRRRRRRRRRRGGRERESTGIAANAPQPSDDALAAIAPRLGHFSERPETGTSDGEDAEVSQEGHAGGGRRGDGRRRRPRGRGGRGQRDRANAPATEANWPADTEVDHFAGDLTPDAAAAYNSSMIDGLEPHVSADRSEPAPEPASAAPSPSPAETEDHNLVEEAVDPNRPKRTGWWQRAKASI